jgi:hypothetical protein
MSSKKKNKTAKELPSEDGVRVGATFKTDDFVAASGIYTVQPDDRKLDELEVTCVRGKKFPPCNKCKGKATFTLKTKAKHWKHHDAFGK